MKTELNELLEFAVGLAHGAGEITLQYFRKQPETSKKSDGSYVTIADREAESFLRRGVEMSQVIVKRSRVSRRHFLRGLTLAGSAVQIGLPPLVANACAAAYSPRQ